MSAAGPKQWGRYLLRLLLTAVILFGLFSIADFDSLRSVLSQMSLVAFVGAALLHVAGSIVIPAVVSWLSTRGTPLRLGLARLVAINLSIRFYTMVLPRATATGVRWLKYRNAGGGAHAAALVVLEKLVQVFVYSAAAVIFVIVEASTIGQQFVPILLVGLGAMGGAGVGLFAVFSDRLDPLLSRFTFTKAIPSLHRRLLKIAVAVTAQRGRPLRDVVKLGCWSLAGYVFFVLSAWVVVQDLDIGLTFAGTAWIRGVVFLGTLIPFTIAGAGIREAGFVGFASFYGIEASVALGLALALLGLQIAIGSVGGLLELREQFTEVGRRTVEPTEMEHADV